MTTPANKPRLINTLRQERDALMFIRLLVSYGCAGVDQDVDDIRLCDVCGPCMARKWLDSIGARTQ